MPHVSRIGVGTRGPLDHTPSYSIEDEFARTVETDHNDKTTILAEVPEMHTNLYEILIRFQEENGRGPDILELLAVRKPVADHFGVLVRDVNEEADG